jgi:hypothetical protein
MKKVVACTIVAIIAVGLRAVDYESVEINLQIVGSEIEGLTRELQKLSKGAVPPAPIAVDPQIKAGNAALIPIQNSLYQLPRENIYQLRVFAQVDGASCGYHALKNGILILNAFIAGDNVTERDRYLAQLADEVLYQSWLDKWSVLIREKRKSDDGQWLHGYEIEGLIESKVPEKLEHRPQFITVIDNPDWLTKSEPGEASGLLEKIITVIKSYQNNPNFRHSFLLANSREYQDQKGFVRGTWTHWIAVGVQKVNGKPQYIILDSANANRTSSEHVSELIKTLENADLDNLEIKISPIDSSLGTIATVLDKIGTEGFDPDKVYATVVERVNKIIQLAKEKKWQSKAAFAPYKQKLKEFVGQLENLVIRVYGEFATNPEKKIKDLQDLMKQIDALK